MHFEDPVALAAKAFSWLVALAWTTGALSAWRGLPSIPNLLLPEHDLTPPGNPALTVIVPARNEEDNVAACLQSLLQQDYSHLQILTVDDRSTDRTGALIDSLAAAHPSKLRALHITALPSGWLGKTHAMALAAQQAIGEQDPDFLLFTDADVLFHPAALRRALANAELTRADHLVLMPTTIIRRWDEGALLSFFQIFGLWAARPWRVADPRALRDAVGIGAFNLIRSTAYRQIGGFRAFPMEIVEDLGLGRRVKLARLRQRVVFGHGLVRVHWAPGASGLSRVLTKNIFSLFNFHASLLLGACAWLALFALAPFVAVFFPPFTLPAAVALAAIFCAYVLIGRSSGLSPRNFFLAPFACALLIFTMLRSMFTTLHQGGVVWRGTLYPLAELRNHTAPLIPRRPKKP